VPQRGAHVVVGRFILRVRGDRALEQAQRLLGATVGELEASQVVEDDGVLRMALECLPVQGLRVVDSSRVLEEKAEVVVGADEVRIRPEGLPVGGLGLREGAIGLAPAARRARARSRWRLPMLLNGSAESGSMAAARA
jgi:hypothetical protein